MRTRQGRASHDRGPLPRSASASSGMDVKRCSGKRPKRGRREVARARVIDTAAADPAGGASRRDGEMPLPLATWLATLWVTQSRTQRIRRSGFCRAAAPLSWGGCRRVMECGWESDEKRVGNDKWLSCIPASPLPRATRAVGAALQRQLLPPVSHIL